MGNRNTSFGRVRKLTAWVMAFVMILTFFATPLAQVALAAPDESGSEILSDGTDIGVDAGVTQSGEDSPEEEDQTPPASTEGVEGDESRTPAEDVAPAEGTEGTEGGEAAEGTVETEPLETEPVEEETEPVESETEPVEAGEPAEAETPADTVTVTARWYITSQNEEIGALEDTLVFTKTLTGARGATESVNVKDLDPETEYSLLGYEADDERSGTVLGVYELLFDEDKELAFYFVSADLLQRAPENGVYVSFYRNVSGTAPVYTVFLTPEQLVELTAINAASYYLAAGISAAWTLNTSRSGAAQARTVNVGDIAGSAVDFYFDAPAGSWAGVEPIANPVNPQAVGQSVVVYTYAALKAALESTAYSYIEFGANLSYTGSSNTDARITVPPTRVSPELMVDAKGHSFSSTRASDNIIRFAGTTANSTLTQVTYRDWNVPALLSNSGIFNATSTRVITMVFDGLTFVGPQLATFSSESDVILDGSRNPVNITITQPSGSESADHVVDNGSNLLQGELFFQGQVSITRVNVSSTSSAMFDGFEVITARTDADVSIRDYRATGLFVAAPWITVESDASFTYRGNQRFTSGNLTGLVVGAGATFDLRTTGNIASTGALRVNGPVTVGAGANFIVAAESNTNGLPAVYAAGAAPYAFTINNPNTFLVYNSSANASARAFTFAAGKPFSFTGRNLSMWATAPAAVVPTEGSAYAAPSTKFENPNKANFSVTGTLAANSSFSSVSASGYSGATAVNTTYFTFLGRKVVAVFDWYAYAIDYKVITENGDEVPAEGLFPAGYAFPQTGTALLGSNVSFYPLRLGNYERIDGQPSSLHIEAAELNSTTVYYRPLVQVAPDPILSKTAQRLDDDTWEITVSLSGESGQNIVDLDVMMALDHSGSMGSAGRTAVKNAAKNLTNMLSQSAQLTGTIRVGVVQFASASDTSTRILSPLRVVRDNSTSNAANVAALVAAIDSMTSGGSTYIQRGMSLSRSELFHPGTATSYYTPTGTVYNPASTKYMIVLTDGAPTGGTAGAQEVRNEATAYKNEGENANLITIGYGTSQAASALLQEIQNAGFYTTANNSASLDGVFQSIGDSLITTIKRSEVVDPVGQGFYFVGTNGQTIPTTHLLNVTSYVTVSQGKVNMTILDTVFDSTPALVWDSVSGIGGEQATLKYRVRLSNPNASANQVLTTNGVTHAAYTNVYNQTKIGMFEVPQVAYQRGAMQVVYEGLPADITPTPTTFGPTSMYNVTPQPYTFGAPAERIGDYWLTGVSLKGTEVTVLTPNTSESVSWDVTADSLEELSAATSGRVTILGNGQYAVAVPASDDMRVVFTYGEPEEYVISYYNVGGDMGTHTNPVSYSRNTTPVTLTPAGGRLGYTFTGWYEDNQLTVPAGVPAIPDGETGARDFYAMWGDGDTPDVYTITYHNLEPAEATHPNPETYTILTPDIILAPAEPTLPAFVFDGWYKDAALTQPVGEDEHVTVKDVTTGHLDFYVKWAEDVTVKYNQNLPVYNGQPAQEAPGSTAFPASETYTKYTNVTLADGSGLKLLGYNFKGWALSPDAPATSVITRIDGIQVDTEVYAIWQDNPVDPPTTVTMTYHAGNATGGAPPTDSRQYLINENVTILGNVGVPPLYRIGYEFEGWSGTSGGALQHAVGSQIQEIQVDADLYPTWTGAERVKVFYDANLPADGVRMSGAVPDVTEAEKFSDVTLPGNTNGLVVTGYDFAGWATTPNAVAPEEKILRIATDTTVYAVWRPAADITVTYYRGSAEPGIGVPPEDGNSPYPKHSTVRILGNVGAGGLGGLVKYGYEFMGWSFTEGGSVVNALSNTDLYNVEGNLRLYPVFGDAANYGVQYFRNDPESGVYKSGGVPIDGNRYDSHVTVQLAGNMGAGNTQNPGPLVMLGYDFIGWARVGESTVITQIVDITKDEELNAMWRKDPKPGGYSVIYYAGAATGGTVPTDSNSPYLKHADVTILGNTGNLTLAGKEFVGWARSASATTPEFRPGDATSGVLRDIQADEELYAVFSTDTTWVTVTYDLNLPSGAEQKSGHVPNPTSHLVHTTAALAAPAADLVVLGYDFGGWTRKPGPTAVVTQIADITEDVTVYAIWNGVPGTGDPGDPANPQQPLTYTVEYRRGDASGGDAPAGGTYRKHETVTVSANTGVAPSFEPLYQIGRDVAGWALTQGGTIAILADGSGRIADIAQNYTLYPAWSEGPLLYQTVTYVANVPGDGVQVGGTVPEGDLYAIYLSFLKHTDVELPGNVGGLLVTGYDFAGWSENPAGPVVEKILQIATDKTVYAVWTAAAPVTVTYHRGSAEPGIGAPPSNENNTYPKHSRVLIVGNVGGL
ncbi:MAG: InlB B-repeat-containing protein, partial [Oscillospiraceae bacterium]|nr:InlB B-repeat-containing protein [Oscillospiraceae bacterium]